MREKPNSYLSACLVMVGMRTLTISCNAPTLLYEERHWADMRLFETGKKPTHVHIMNRTCH
jgi:hypothetical protein